MSTMWKASAAYLDQVGEFVASFRLSDAPPEVVEHARLILLDTVGAVVSGTAASEVQALQQRLGTGLRGGTGRTASSPGSPHGFAPSTAAFLNGTAGTWDELDEGNYTTHQHPAVHVVPAALATAEAEDATGAALLEAVIVGYEVSARAGMATTFRDDVMHPHGTHGILGGAAAVASLLEFSAGDAREILRVASSMSVATTRGAVFQGATVRNTFAGQSGQNAVLAGDLVLAGITGQHDGPAAAFGAVSGTTFDQDVFVDGLGTDFVLTRNYFKFHACCAYNHATLDALRVALDGRTLRASDVAGVDVDTYFPATRMTATEVAVPLAAKFSLPYTVSAMITRGTSDRSTFAPAVLQAPDIRELMTRVRIHEDPAATADYPRLQRSNVRIELVTGDRLTASVDRVRGDWRDPVPTPMLMEKFDRITSHLPGGSTALKASLLSVESQSARQLGQLL